MDATHNAGPLIAKHNLSITQTVQHRNAANQTKWNNFIDNAHAVTASDRVSSSSDNGAAATAEA